MNASPWCPGLLSEAARFAPDPAVALRLAALDAWPEVSSYDHLLATRRLQEACPGLTFTLQPPRPRRRPGPPPVPYDESILSGAVPTRARSWHDLFNALIWAALPAAKMALHRRQHELIRRRLASSSAPPDAPRARSRQEDTLAMIDEGGLLLAHLPAAGPALRRTLALGEQGALDALAASGQLRPVVFGHALLEHLARGELAVRGFPLPLEVATLDLLAIEEALAGAVRQVDAPSARPGVPVPATFFAIAG